MISITADEKKKILEQYPNVFITRTMKQDSKRHHYYMEEQSAAMRLLRRLRGQEQKNSYGVYRGRRQKLCLYGENSK